MQIYKCEKCGHVYNVGDKFCPICGTKAKFQTSRKLKEYLPSLLFVIFAIFLSVLVFAIPILTGSANSLKYSTYSGEKINYKYRAGEDRLWDFSIGNQRYMVCVGWIRNLEGYNFEGGDLKSIEIPRRVDFDEILFPKLSNCQSIKVSAFNKWLKSKDNAILDNSGEILLRGCQNTVIPTSVKEISSYAFADCGSLFHIVIPSSVEYINEAAFENCENLEIVTFEPNTKIEQVDDNAFSGCVKIKDIVIPDSKKHIKDIINKSIQSGILLSVYFDEDLEYHTGLLEQYGYQLFSENRLYGLKSKSNVILSAEYKSIYLSDDGSYLYAINQLGKSGVFSIKKKRWTIPCEFDDILPLGYSMHYKGTMHFSPDDYLYVTSGGKCGVYYPDGREIAPIIYNKISQFQHIWGVRDKAIDIISSISLDKRTVDCEEAIPCDDTLCLIKRNKKWGVINDEGELIIPTQYDSIPDQTDSDFYGLMNSKEILSHMYYDEATAKQEYDVQKEIIVINRGKCGLVGLDGKEYLPCDYDYISWYYSIGEAKQFVRLLFRGDYNSEEGTYNGIWDVYFDGEILIHGLSRSSNKYQYEVVEEFSSKIEEAISFVDFNSPKLSSVPNTSSRRLIESDLTGLSKKELRILRNEIYARHGYIFKSKDLADYFKQFDWYTPISDDVSSSLTAIEHYNVDFIKNHE